MRCLRSHLVHGVEYVTNIRGVTTRKRRRRLRNSSNNKVSPPMASLIRPRGPRWGSSPTREKPRFGATLASLACGVLVGAR